MFLRRYPLASRWGLALPIGGTLLGNGLVVWLVISGRMTPFELVMLVAIEALLLMGIAWLQKRSVPPEAVEANPMTLKDRLTTLAFLLLLLGGMYGFVFFDLVPSEAEILGFLRDPVAFLSASSLKWPLLITLITASIDVLQDHAHFRRHGDMFFSTPQLQGAARGLTLILGGIPYLVPVVCTAICLHFGVKRMHAWLTRGVRYDFDKGLIAIFLGLGVMASIVGALMLLDRIDAALGHGVQLWTLGYGAAKFVAELFIVCMPLIAAAPGAEDADEAVES